MLDQNKNNTPGQGGGMDDESSRNVGGGSQSGQNPNDKSRNQSRTGGAGGTSGTSGGSSSTNR